MLLSDPASRRQPLHLTRPSPPSGWPEDLHLQTAEHAQHTTKPRCGIRPALRWSAFHPSVSLAAKPYDLRCLRVSASSSISRTPRDPDPDGTVAVSPCQGDCGRRWRAASEKRAAPIANFKLFSLFISITYRSEKRNSSRRDANLESEICIFHPNPASPKRDISFTASQSLGCPAPGEVRAIGRFASQNFPPSPQPEAEKGLIPTREIPLTLGFCVTTPSAPAASPAAQSRSPRTASPGRLSTRLPTPVTHPPLVFGIFVSTPKLHSLSTYERKVSGEFNERP